MSEETNSLVVIPQKVMELAEKVAPEKREEVTKILNQVFVGVDNWIKQIDSIVVKDHTDTLAMNMAGTARKTVKNARTDMEKMFDTKRDFVQSEKAEFDLLDKLYLSSKQIAVALFKDAEQRAAFKEDTAKRYEIEQKETRTQERLQKVIVFNPTVSRFDIENLSDEMFNVFLSGLEKEHNDRIEAEQKAEADRIENERLLKLLSERRFSLAKFSGFYTSTEEITINTTEEEFNAIVLDCEKAKKEYEVQQEKQRLENERLKKEAEQKEKELAAERAKAEQERKIAEAKAQKEREEAAEKLRKEQEVARVAAEKAAQEKAKLEAQLKAQKEAEERAENEKRIAAEKAQKDADKLAKAPLKKQLYVWVNSFSIQNAPIENNEVADNINSKFNAFKNWALEQIEKL